MMQNDDAQYYQNRKRAALAMSQAATDPAVRNIHRELASRYDALAEGPSEAELEVAARDCSVEIVTPSGAVTILTPNAATATSDRLLVRTREARRQTSTTTADVSSATARQRLSLPTFRKEQS